jgi:Phage integrase central domain
MGRHLMRRPPKFVHGFIDRHGKPRWYFRRAGFKQVRLPGLPWSPEFMAAYEQALAGQPAPVGAERTMPGTLRALAASYFASPAFRTTRPSTQYTYRNIIDRLCVEHGDKRVALLQRDHVVKLLAARTNTPRTANALRQSLRALMQHAVEIGLRADDPTRDVRKIPTIKGEGYHSWTESEIAQFEHRHPVGSRARLAFALLLYTGQRRSDVVRMGHQHIKDGGICVFQQKTGREVWIPVHEALAPIIAETSTNLTFLLTDQGKPYTAAGFGNWFRDQWPGGGLERMQRPRAPQGCGAALGRSGMQYARDRGDHRPRQPEGGRALHGGCRPETARKVGHGQNQNIEWQT